MRSIRFVTVKAERLAAVMAIIIVVLSLLSYWALTHNTTATRVPKSVLWYAVPAAAGPELAPVATMQVGAAAPHFTLATAGGEPVSLQAWLGRPVLLYFWASWCSFCRDDMPTLQQHYDQYKDAGLQILAINLLEQADNIAAFGKRLHLTYPLLLDSQAAVSQLYLVKATPTYIFIDKNGVVQAQLVGRPQDAVFNANLSLILAADNAEADSANLANPAQ